MEATLSVIWNALQVFATGILAIGGAGAIFVGIYRWAKKPDTDRDEKLKGHDEKLDNDNRRLNELEKKQDRTDQDLQMLMTALSALMTHAIDGNHTNELKKARDEMQEYLIKR